MERRTFINAVAAAGIVGADRQAELRTTQSDARVRDGSALLGMKSLGHGVILKSGTVMPVECLRSSNLPTSAVITGIDDRCSLD